MKKLVIGLLTTLLFLSIVSMLTASVFYNITSHDNAKKLFISEAENQVSDMNEVYNYSQKVCKINDSFVIQMNETLDINNITIKCSEFSNENELKSVVINKIFDEVYNKDYNGIANIKQNPAELMSSYAHQQFKGMLRITIIITVIIVILLFLLTVPRYKALYNIGYTSLVIGLGGIITSRVINIAVLKKALYNNFIMAVYVGAGLIVLGFLFGLIGKKK